MGELSDEVYINLSGGFQEDLQLCLSYLGEEMSSKGLTE